MYNIISKSTEAKDPRKATIIKPMLKVRHRKGKIMIKMDMITLKSTNINTDQSFLTRLTQLSYPSSLGQGEHLIVI